MDYLIRLFSPLQRVSAESWSRTREFIAKQLSPGLILIPQRLAIGVAIEELELVWECAEDAELWNHAIYLPF